jgi:tetrahydromethanopterin S-methyltransferase subunit A
MAHASRRPSEPTPPAPATRRDASSIAPPTASAAPHKGKERSRAPGVLPPVPHGEGGAGSPWTPDPRGNFLIALEGGQLVAAHATTTGGPTGYRFVGRTAVEVYRAIVAAGLVSQLDHAAYLGAELARAEVALRAALPYRQDEPPVSRRPRPGGRRGAS